MWKAFSMQRTQEVCDDRFCRHPQSWGTGPPSTSTLIPRSSRWRVQSPRVHRVTLPIRTAHVLFSILGSHVVQEGGLPSAPPVLGTSSNSYGLGTQRQKNQMLVRDERRAWLGRWEAAVTQPAGAVRYKARPAASALQRQSSSPPAPGSKFMSNMFCFF